MDKLFFEDAFTESENNINLEVNQLKASCINSNENTFSIDSDGNIIAKSIQTVDPITSNVNYNTILNLVYPVGSLYLSTNSTDPSTLFGGTWEAFAKGKTLVGIDSDQVEFDTVEKSGGEKSHVLTINELPSHGHSFTGSSHTHSIPALSGATNSTGGHTHKGKIRATDGHYSGDITEVRAYNDTSGTDGLITNNSGAHSHTVSTNASTTGGTIQGGTVGTTGDSQAHNNLQPYIVINIWKRTA